MSPSGPVKKKKKKIKRKFTSGIGQEPKAPSPLLPTLSNSRLSELNHQRCTTHAEQLEQSMMLTGLASDLNVQLALARSQIAALKFQLASWAQYSIVNGVLRRLISFSREHRTPRQLLQFWAEVARDMSEAATIDISYLLNDHGRVVTEQNSLNENEPPQ